MNTSFRTAFWALCLGLSVPMVMFVAFRLASGGRADRTATLAAADLRSSLKTKLEKSAGKPGPDRSTAPDADAKSSLAVSSQPGSNSRDKVVLDAPEIDPDEPQVVLGPGLESDATATTPASVRDRRVPASAVAETRPKVHYVPEIEAVPTASAASATAIEARLEGIQQNLDRLGRALDAQSSRAPTGDPIKQATELLKQLQDAHLINQPASPPGEQIAAQPRGETGQPPPATDPSRESPTPDSQLRKSETQLVTRIYRPRYLSGSALHSLIVPLLTPNLGRAGAADMATDETHTTAAGNNSAAPADALVVSDFPEALRKIDLLFQKLDTPPTHLVIEAVVLSLRLNHGMPNGIDLLEFNGPAQPFTMTSVDTGGGVGGASPEGSAFAADDPLKLTRKYGLKRGVLTGDPQAFLSALQTATQTRRVDAWQMTVVNRQPADLLLSDPFGPGGSCSQSAAGTILKIRPVLARNGVVHLDVRREVAFDMSAAGTRAAALTNQFSLREGQTAVIGGFIAEQSALQSYRPPGIGQVPVIGELFRKQAETIERTETIVLLTPHVVPLEAESQITHKSRASSPTSVSLKTPRILPTSGTSGRRGPAKLPRKSK